MATTAKSPASAKPVESFRRRGISVAVFENHAKKGDRDVKFHKIAPQRLYRDDEGNWQATTSFGRDDLPVLLLLLQRAWEHVLDIEANREKDDDAE